MSRTTLAMVSFFTISSACAQTQWDHNGSLVTLQANGNLRQFVYLTPRSGLPVSSGTLLFSGRRSGKSYSGTAYVFSARCGARGYSVSGLVGDDDRSVTLFGKAPLVDATCRTAAFRDDTLVFNLQEPVSNTGTSVTTQTDFTSSIAPIVNESVSNYQQEVASLEQAISNARSQLQSLEYDASLRLATAEKQARELIETANAQAKRILTEAHGQAELPVTGATGDFWEGMRKAGTSKIPLNSATLLGGLLLFLLVGLHLLGQQDMSKLTRAIVLAGAQLLQAVIAWLWGIKDEITILQLPILILPYLGVVGLSLGIHPAHVPHGRLH